MSTPPTIKKHATALDSMSTTAAAEQLRAETRAFGNAAAKLNLQRATNAFLKAKESFLVHATQASKISTKSE